MDVSMPFMGGMEATEIIRAFEIEKGIRRTPIIALTAHAMIGDRERCIQAGMVSLGYLILDCFSFLRRTSTSRNPSGERIS